MAIHGSHAPRVVEVYTGLGMGMGLSVAGLKIVRSYDSGLTREILTRSGFETEEIVSLQSVARGIVSARADVLAGYPLTEEQALDLVHLSGMTRTEWIIMISPRGRVSDVRPWLWRYGYGVTSLDVKATDYSSADGGIYQVTVARLHDRDGFLADGITARKQEYGRELPEHLKKARPVDLAAALKSLPKMLVLEDTDTVLQMVQSACPTPLAYRIGAAVVARHKGTDIPVPDRDAYNELITQTIADADDSRPLSERTIANFFPRLRKAREILGARTFHSLAVEEAELERAAKEMVPEISGSVLSDLKVALRWDRRLHEVRCPSERKDVQLGSRPKRRSAPGLSYALLDGRFLFPPVPPVPKNVPNFNVSSGSEYAFYPEIDGYPDDDGDDQPPPFDGRKRIRIKGRKRGRPPGSRNKAKPKT